MDTSHLASRTALQREGWESHRRALSLLPAALTAWLVASILLSAPRAHPDCAMYLQAAEMLLEGKRPYVDIVDLNPPMVIYQSVLPVALARLSGAHPMRMFALVVALIVAWSARSSWSSLARLPGFEGPLAAGLVASSVVGVSVWLWCGDDFGQREHVMFLLYMPYLCARAVDSAGSSRGIAACARGFAAGLGVGAKPHYAGVVVVVELFFLAVRRDVRMFARADFAGLVAAGVAYGAHFALLPSDIREAFLYRWVPLIRRGYAAYDSPISGLWNPAFSATVIFAAAVVLSRLRWRSALADLSAALGLATIASAALYLAQTKGWFYHTIPMRAFAATAAACVAAGGIAWMMRSGSRAWTGTSAAILGASAALALALTFVPWKVRLAYAPKDDPFREFVQRYTREGEPVLVCSTVVQPAYPLLTEQNRRPGSRFLWLFPLAMMAKTQAAPEEAAWLAVEEQRFIDELKQDVTASPPALVITPAPQAGVINITDYLRSRGVFTNFGAYQEVGTVAGYAVYARPRASEP